MKLKNLCHNLKSEECPNKIHLVSCHDANNLIETFIEAVIASKCVKNVVVRTDFLTSMAGENVIKFFGALGDMQCLEELSIQSSSRFHVEEIPPSGLLSLRHASSLKSLTVDDMQVTAAQRYFITGLSTAIRCHPSLEIVTMRNFFANDWANTDVDVLDPLVDSLASLPNLNQLEFSGCGSHALTGQNTRLLSTASLGRLMGRPTLSKLVLSFLELEDDHFETVARALQESVSLEILHMDYHRLSHDGIRAMMLALRHENQTAVKMSSRTGNQPAATTLVDVSLRSLQDIGHDGFDEVMETLRINYSIRSLSITASPSQQAKIDLLLRMNQAGRCLLREPTASHEDLFSMLLCTKDDIDVVRHLLQEIPSLCDISARLRE